MVREKSAKAILWMLAFAYPVLFVENTGLVLMSVGASLWAGSVAWRNW